MLTTPSVAAFRECLFVVSTAFVREERVAHVVGVMQKPPGKRCFVLGNVLCCAPSCLWWVDPLNPYSHVLWNETAFYPERLKSCILASDC